MDDPGSCSKNISLIGFMGAGKSSVARKLRERLDTYVIDTDEEIEESQNMTVGEIFASQGETAFRKMERELLGQLHQESMLDDEPMVISCGGGMLLDPDNRRMLKEMSQVIYLRADAQTILKRLQKGTQAIAELEDEDDPDVRRYVVRPLLGDEITYEKVCALMEEREAFYLEAADQIIDVDGKTTDMIVGEILDAGYLLS